MKIWFHHIENWPVNSTSNPYGDGGMHGAQERLVTTKRSKGVVRVEDLQSN